MPEIENAPNNNRDRILPLAWHLPPRSQAGEPPPRRERQPESLRFQTLRRQGADPTRRALAHSARHACLRGAGDFDEERLQRRDDRHLVMRRHFVRSALQKMRINRFQNGFVFVFLGLWFLVLNFEILSLGWCSWYSC